MDLLTVAVAAVVVPCLCGQRQLDRNVHITPTLTARNEHVNNVRTARHCLAEAKPTTTATNKHDRGVVATCIAAASRILRLGLDPNPALISREHGAGIADTEQAQTLIASGAPPLGDGEHKRKRRAARDAAEPEPVRCGCWRQRQRSRRRRHADSDARPWRSSSSRPRRPLIAHAVPPPSPGTRCAL